ncbi:MAG TPA: NAD(P)H-binding protein, partial [Chitinophagaceae bacterium]|nr:NAD(P)H-binding protein [Chitinophagaceae bacterium]
MRYIVTGGAGNISKPLIKKLLEAGHEVIAVGRNADHLKELTTKGAKQAIGSIEDTEFLKKTFAGADAVYTMIPPNYTTTDLKNWMRQIGKNYADAIQASNVKYVVNLSSVGAHLPNGCGPVSGLYHVEQALNQIKNIHLRHLRPVYFFSNFLGSIGMVKQMNIIGANFGGESFKMALADTNDVAEVAFGELNNGVFPANSVRYIASDERTTDEIAKVLGTAIGKPDLHWVVFTDEQAFNGMLQAGLPEELAKNYTEMGHAIQTGIMMEDYWKQHPAPEKTKLEDF